MTFDPWPSTHEFLDAFAAAVADAGGRVSDTYNDGGRLFTRAVLPTPREVAPGDRLQAGVALRATDADVRVHPYVFRVVCRNGAIAAQAIQTVVIERGETFDVLRQVRDAVRACCGDDAFARAVSDMRTAREREVDVALNLAPLLAALPRTRAGLILDAVFGRFERDGDRSRFGLMNAVTATARDTRDPDLRWRLEEFGGAIPALVRADAPRDGAAAAALIPA